MNKQLSFFKTEKIVTRVETEVERGIAYYCCKEMEIACKPFKTKEKERYNPKNYIYADSVIYDDETNKIGIHMHTSHDYDFSSYGETCHNFKEFKYCPFCGTKINGYVLLENEKDD
jgi:dihydroxyacetone kinase-like predicted kinase